ncbi:MAG: adenosylcobalamin-dependent ribonucleoside-diphosphate reductase [Planctomycetes bacterium]|nr:adenosylcobalamin-dependent ribonucleoside-diphosphate reductase [Planctomycetota bacterium]
MNRVHDTGPPPGLEPAFDAHALRVLEARYLRRDERGEVVETPLALLWRVARAVAAAEAAHGGDPEAQARAFYEALARLEFLPNSPTLMNAGRPRGQLSACFVLPVEDELEAIFDTVKHAARIHQTGGGTGFAFSRLRPRHARLSSGGEASGPVSFMKVFDAATAAVYQGGVRRGANMGILRVDHPDVLEFIDAKREPGVLTHFNISVAITDAFMQALEQGGRYDLLDAATRQPVGSQDARTVWERIVRSAWATGDPGLVFIDRINALHPTPNLGEIESTNPCGELPLLPYESCNLGSVDIHKHLLPDASGLDRERLRRTVHLGVRFLDDVIDSNVYPLPQIAEVTRTNRKIGLGVMGLADALIALGIPYASERAVALAHEVMAFVLAEARAASRALARERGPFLAWEGSRPEQAGEAPLRNATVTTIAPTGTIALLAGCSSGIEPLYAVAYVRRALDGKARLEIFHPQLERVARARGFWSEDLRAHVLATGTLEGAPGVPDDVRALFATAHEIAPEWHVRMQAAFQAHVENSVSKTINLPRGSRPDDVAEAYLLAYRLGCKGITVYRDGSREGQVLATQPDGKPVAASPEHEPSPLPPANCPECAPTDVP